LIIVSSILKSFVAFRAWGWLAGMTMISPEVRRNGWPEIDLHLAIENLDQREGCRVFAEALPFPKGEQRDRSRLLLDERFAHHGTLLVANHIDQRHFHGVTHVVSLPSFKMTGVYRHYVGPG